MPKPSSSVQSRIVFLIGVLLLGALLIYKSTEPPRKKESASQAVIQKDAPTTAATYQAARPAPAASAVGPLIEAAPKNLSVDEQKKWDELREIIGSKNDNDPRLDKDLKNLSEAFHAELYQEYRKLPMEKRNERGLLAFLIARDLKSSQDFDFLKSIYDESPCLSLGDCATRAQSDPHLSDVDQNSLNYPQLAVLYQLQRQVKAKNKIFDDNKFREQLKALLAQASQFQVPAIQKKANELLGQQ